MTGLTCKAKQDMEFCVIKMQHIKIILFDVQNEMKSSKDSESGILWAHQANSKEENREQVQPLYGQKQVNIFLFNC